MERKYSFAPEPIGKTDQYILEHLAPVEYGLYHDAYLCGVSIENKNWYMYTMLEKLQAWVERNGGKCVVWIRRSTSAVILERKDLLYRSCSQASRNVISTTHPLKEVGL